MGMQIIAFSLLYFSLIKCLRVVSLITEIFLVLVIQNIFCVLALQDCMKYHQLDGVLFSQNAIIMFAFNLHAHIFFRKETNKMSINQDMGREN